jgi:hypothetical protein
MPANITNDAHDTHSRPARPIRSQSSSRVNYYPHERIQRVRPLAPNAFVAARMGYRAFD